MSHMKGTKLEYGVSCDACSNLSSAGSLYKQQRLIVFSTFNLKRTPINLMRCSKIQIRTE